MSESLVPRITTIVDIIFADEYLTITDELLSVSVPVRSSAAIVARFLL